MKKTINLSRIIIPAVLALLLLLSACGKKVPESIPSSESPSERSAEGASDTRDPVSTKLVLASFNIKNGSEGLEKIADAIKEISPDIIGLQEVDVNCERSGFIDEPAQLASLAGYPYHAFSRAISLGSGEYGTAILSRYPIESFEVIPLDSGNTETRSLGHAVVLVEGAKLDVFVTHLSFEDRSLRIAQMKTIAGLLKNCEHYALMGDLNSFNIEDIRYLEGAYYVNRPDRQYATFRRFNVSPDNIVVSSSFTELSSGTSDAEASDHKLLYARFRFTP